MEHHAHNLKDKLIQAKFADGVQCTRALNHYKTVPLQNTPTTTYSKTQLITNTNFITLRPSKDHKIITNEYNNLLEATKKISRGGHPFITQHTKCGKNAYYIHTCQCQCHTKMHQMRFHIQIQAAPKTKRSRYGTKTGYPLTPKRTIPVTQHQPWPMLLPKLSML